EKVKKMMVFQTLTMPGMDVVETEPDYEINDREKMREEGWPKMAFIEKKLAGDITNWWAPNHSAIVAMFRSTGLQVMDNPTHETYILKPDPENISSSKTWNRSEFLSA